MRHCLAVVVFVMLAAPAMAAPVLPSRFDVTGVGENDALNVRSEPTTSAAVIARLAHDVRGVEVVTTDTSGRWGRVNTGEASGWVAMRYLSEEPGVWTEGALPAGLRCFGTEPFWSLVPEGKSARIESPEASQSYALTTLDLGHPANLRRALVLTGEAGSATATITPRTCSDGMSDRLFGLEMLLVVAGPNGLRFMSGCCSVAGQ